MRANPELAKKLKAIIRNQAETKPDTDNFELINLDKPKRLYGVKINS